MNGHDRFELSGKVALVTGASQGLGQAIAIGLAEAGAHLALLDQNACHETEKQIRALSRKVISYEMNLLSMSPTKSEHLINGCVQKLGRFDILVNNAGIIRRSPAAESSEQEWHEVLSVNLHAVFFLCQAAGRHFLHHRQRGKIINLASMLSFQGGKLVASYAASKSAIAGLTKALANEWAGQGINVNALAPGYFSTDVTAGIRKDRKRNEEILNRIPAGRWGAANDLKGAAVFLASSASDYIHGTLIPIDGGWLGR